MQKRKKIPALLLTLLLMLVLAPAAYADTDANTPQITQQPDQLVLQLGARWAEWSSSCVQTPVSSRPR